jgi:serine phosphatase RsbU (regulator of sigma subunit)
MAQINRTPIRRAIQSASRRSYGMLAPDGRLTYSNAAQSANLGPRRRRLETGGLILGLSPHATYEEETIQFEEGDTLVVFSDVTKR